MNSTLRNRMLLGTVVVSILALFGLKSRGRTFHTPINTVETIKRKDTYGTIQLTMESYCYLNDEIRASFNHKGRKASVTLDIDPSDRKIAFKSLGDESDYFLEALAALFEERAKSAKMKERVVFSFVPKGDDGKIDLYDEKKEYVVHYRPNATVRGSVELRMKINRDTGTIRLWEHHGGIAKKNLIHAFQAN